MTDEVELYHELYPGEGTARIYLNGIAMSTAHWSALREHMDPGPDLLHDFKDQLRSGRSSAAYTMQSHVDEMRTLMLANGLSTAHVIGTSYGSEVAMLAALEYPELCRSLVVIDGVSEVDARLRAAVNAWRTAALTDPRCFYRTMIPWNYSPEYIEDNRAALEAREDVVASLPREYFEGFARLCDAFLSLDITERLSEITCPTLVLVGEADILKPLSFSRIINSRIRGSRLEVIPGAGHAAVIEKPRDVAERINRFLRTVDESSDEGPRA